MKKQIVIIAIFTLLFFSLIGALNAFAKTNEEIMVPTVLKDTYVYDQGNFIDDEIEKSVNNLLDQLESQTTIEFAVITIPSLNHLEIDRYAYKLATELGIGKKDKDNGILLLISKTDSKVRLEIGNGLQGILTDSISGRILDDYFVPFRSEGNYEEAVTKTVHATINVLADSEEYNFEIDGLDKEVKVKDTSTEEAIAAIVIIIIIIGLAILIAYLDDGTFTGGSYRGGRFSGGGGGFSGGSFGGGGFSGGGASR